MQKVSKEYLSCTKHSSISWLPAISWRIKKLKEKYDNEFCNKRYINDS